MSLQDSDSTLTLPVINCRLPVEKIGHLDLSGAEVIIHQDPAGLEPLPVDDAY